jgi:hypothetical protein
VVPGHDDMGIKWREGRLEIKGRAADLGDRTFAQAIEGRYEHWLKWTYAGAATERRFGGLFRDDVAHGVVTVEKRRLQCYLRLDPSGVVEVGLNDPRERGANIELAQIRIPGSSDQQHWSLAFEAFPADDQTSERFAPVVRRFLEGFPALPLTADRSMSYPRWLLSFDQTGASSG